VRTRRARVSLRHRTARSRHLAARCRAAHRPYATDAHRAVLHTPPHEARGALPSPRLQELARLPLLAPCRDAPPASCRGRPDAVHAAP
jgi:hypothetical protein